MTTESKYRRLPGRSGFFVRNSLWIGADHVLSVRRNPSSESYRRYYFADIQAIVLTELPNATALYGYIAGATLILVACTSIYEGHPVWGTLCAVLALVVSWPRPDCACYLKTSVSTDKLPSLWRLRNASKTVALLKTEIERTQGSVSAEAMEVGLPQVRARVSTAPLTPARRHCGGQVHWIAFSLLLVRGVIAAIALRDPTSMPLGVAASAVGAVVLLLLVLAAIQQRNSDMALSVRRVVYMTLAFYLASGLVSFAVSIYIAFQLGPGHANPATIMSYPGVKAYDLIDVIGFFALGFAGLILMWRHHRTVSTPPPLALGNGE